MPKEDFPRHFGRRWWRDVEREPGPGSTADSAEWADHMRRFRPAWWPENEPWPPTRRRWPRDPRRPFLRRIGCVFFVFSLFIAGVIVSVVLLVLNALGLTSASLQNATWLAPVTGAALAALLSAAALVGMNVRRMSMPLDELLAASHRVADGDYSVRVALRGPAEVRSLAAAF